MRTPVRLADKATLDDLGVFLKRARDVEDSGVRLSVAGDALTASVAVVRSGSILDGKSAILGMRIARLSSASTDGFDRVVQISSLIDEIERAADRWEAGDVELFLPDSVFVADWSGQRVPQGGWRRILTLPATNVREIASSGIEEVSQAISGDVGQHIVTRVRNTVWHRMLEVRDDAGAIVEALPAGMTFGMVVLGFLGDATEAALYRSDRWLRLSTAHGHVLARSAPSAPEPARDDG